MKHTIVMLAITIAVLHGTLSHSSNHHAVTMNVSGKNSATHRKRPCTYQRHEVSCEEEIKQLSGLLADLHDTRYEKKSTTRNHLAGYPIFELAKKHTVDLEAFYNKLFDAMKSGVLDAPLVRTGFVFNPRAIDPDTGKPETAYIHNRGDCKELNHYREAIEKYLRYVRKKREFRVYWVAGPNMWDLGMS